MPRPSTRLVAAAANASAPPRQNPDAPTLPVHSGMASRWRWVLVMSCTPRAGSNFVMRANASCMPDSSLRSKRRSRRQNMSGTSTTYPSPASRSARPRMLSLIPKISWNRRIPGPFPDSGTAQ